MYWTEHGAGKISRANPDGSNVEALVVADPAHPDPRALDLVAGKAYWGDTRIRRANFDGSELETVLTSPSPAWYVLEALAVDPVGGKVYWSDYGTGIPAPIYRANLDGIHVELIHVCSSPSAHCHGIAVDSAGGKVYPVGLWDDGRGRPPGGRRSVHGHVPLRTSVPP